MSELDAGLVERVASLLRDARYTVIACTVLLLWDMCITLSDEIEFIWRRLPRIGLIPSIYLISKYVSIGMFVLSTYLVSELRSPISITFCQIYIPLNTFAQIGTEILTKCILTLRVVALYNRDKTIKWSLWILFFISYALSISISVLATRYNIAHVSVSLIGGGCSLEEGPKVFAFGFVCPLIHELYMTFLTLRMAARHAYALRHASSAPMLHIFYVEKILYFVAITACRIGLVYIIFANKNLYIGISLLWSLDIMLVSRFYLEMVATSRKGYITTSVWTSHEINYQDQLDISIFARPSVRSDYDLDE